MLAERLRQARLVVGLTQRQVIAKLEATGVSLTAAGLSKYERGGSTPPPSLLLQLAKVLGTRPAYFLADPPSSISWHAFRKHAALGKRQQERVQAWAADRAHSQVWLESLLQTKPARVMPRRERVSDFDAAEEAAQKLRDSWGLGTAAIVNLTAALENRATVVLEYDSDNKGFDGLSGTIDDTHPVIVVQSNQPADRRRFNLAHEIGHLLMDCRDVDGATEERLAHRFGAALLVPKAIAKSELGESRRHARLEEFLPLKRKYGVSIQAWIRRAFDLEIISDANYRALCIEVSKRGWRTAEPDTYSGQEKPARMLQLTMRALAEGIITQEKAAQICPEAVKELMSDESRSPISSTAAMELSRNDRSALLKHAADELASEYLKNEELTETESVVEND